MSKLIDAIKKNDQRSYTELLENPNTELNQQDENGCTALYVAAEKGNIEVIRYLLRKPNIEINLPNNNGTSPLLIAVKNGHLHVIEALLARKEIFLYQEDQDGESPFTAAMDSKYADIKKAIYTNATQIEPSEYFSTSVSEEDEMDKFINSPSSSVSEEDAMDKFINSPSTSVSEEDAMDKFINSPSTSVSEEDEMNKFINSPSTSVSEEDAMDKFIRSSSTRVSEEDEMDKFIRSSSAHVSKEDEIDKFNKENASLNIDQNNHAKKNTKIDALLIAVYEGKADLVKSFLNEGANVNQQYPDGYFLLGTAIEYGHIELVKILLGKGANVNQFDPDRNTPLTAAIESGNVEIVKLLLADKLIDPNLSYPGNNSPLMIALQYNNLPVIKALLSKKEVNVNLTNNAGISPLKRAMSTQDPEILELFKNARPDEFRRHEIAALYDMSLENMSQMIVLGSEEKISDFNKEKLRQKQAENKLGRIFNLEGYLTENFYFTGAPLIFHHKGKDYPIGYEMVYPREEGKAIENVIVEIYGGRTKENFQKDLQSGSLVIEGLFKENCATVRLFLPDYLQSKLQFDIDKKLYDCIQAGIHHFYETLKKNPRSLHSDLENRNLEKSQYFLYGLSFGGTMAVGHAQLYPGTYKYIIHAGGLTDTEDMPIIPYKRKYKHPEVVLPMYPEKIKKMQDEILFFQNVDDNNVNIQNLLKFYEALIKHNKSYLARLCFFEKGNPTESFSLPNKGHGLPKDMVRYWDTVFNFMDHGVSKIPTLHRLSFLLQNRYAKRFFVDTPFEERFLALAHEKMRANKTHADIFNGRKIKGKIHEKTWDQIWSEEYNPLFYALKEVNSMMADPRYREKQIDSLSSQGLITDEAIKLALKNHVQIVKELLREIDKIEISNEEIVDNQEIIDLYRKLLLTKEYVNPLIRRFMLENFYFSNPQLLRNVEPDKEKDWKQIEKQCKSDFESNLVEIKTTIRHAWKMANKLAIEQKSEPSQTTPEKTLETKNGKKTL